MNEETQGMGQLQTEPNTEPPQVEFGITQNTEQPQPESETVQNAEQSDTVIYDAPDVYQSQSGQDIYQTPVTGSESESQSLGGMFSGSVPEDNVPDNTRFYQNTYISPEYGNPYGSSSVYGNEYQNNPYGGNQNSYGNNQYPYGSNGNTAGQNPYENSGNAAAQNPYGNNQDPYGNSQNPYGGNQNPYGGNQNPYGASQNPYGGGQPYGNNQNSYGNNQNPYGSGYGGGPYGYNPQYSPYAVPQKKKYTGLIIGIIITLVVLFLIAVVALFYRTFAVISNRRSEQDRELHDRYTPWDDDYGYDYDDDFDYGDFEDYFYDQYGDNYFDYDYDDEYDYDYDADQYYTLHHDIKDNLSYSVDLETYYYDADSDNVSIEIEYPVIAGENVPNLDKINETIQKEMSAITDYYEEEYADYMDEDSDYFFADATGYVAYMDEDVLSVVFDERIYSDYYSSVSLYCINVDMRDGVILDNVNLINVDDDFSVDFRLRSDEQNGPISELDRMTDQEITKYLSSMNNLIIFYTPQGMEIGFNYSEGWVTVTYQDYKNYLKIF